MKITSRSILSPGQSELARDRIPTTLTPSLSRKLKTSRSIKGGASPTMFPTSSKRKGSGFDNPEPSSPKVTCIGQVRVKTKKKKHAKNMRTLSQRRKLDRSLSQSQQHYECMHGANNQRWVHLPLTICDALRTFGSEVSCLFPCRSSCNSNNEIEKAEKIDGEKERSCGGDFARWLVAYNDDGGNENDEVIHSRRHVFNDLEIVDDSIMGSIDEGRVSICIPPKNALLLMRCRADPMMMEALANRFWEPSGDVNEEEEIEGFFMREEESFMVVDESVDQEIVELDMKENLQEEKIREEAKLSVQEEYDQECEIGAEEVDELVLPVMNVLQAYEIGESKIEKVKEEKIEEKMKLSVQEEDDQECDIGTGHVGELVLPVMNVLQENEIGESKIVKVDEEEESVYLWRLFEENEDKDQEFEKEEEAESDMMDALELLFKMEDIQENETRESNIENVIPFEEEIDDMVIENETHERIVMESEEVENEVLEKENAEGVESIKELPECLLLMMYEPKLSMEVSKETWVCSSDFIRSRSSRRKLPPPPPIPRIKSVDSHDGSIVNAASPSGMTYTAKENDNHVMRMANVQCEPQSHQPARSSCSFPTPTSMARMLEQKLGNAMGYEPLVLTRCRSAPIRTRTAKLRPETFYWKNKLEPPRRASFGIGMAGLGF